MARIVADHLVSARIEPGVQRIYGIVPAATQPRSSHSHKGRSRHAQRNDEQAPRKILNGSADCAASSWAP
jgi:hypothetical protein